MFLLHSLFTQVCSYAVMYWHKADVSLRSRGPIAYLETVLTRHVFFCFGFVKCIDIIAGEMSLWIYSFILSNVSVCLMYTIASKLSLWIIASALIRMPLLVCLRPVSFGRNLYNCMVSNQQNMMISNIATLGLLEVDL